MRTDPTPEPGDLDRVAELLDLHTDQTDRSARDGCSCGYPDPSTYPQHVAAVLAAEGLLA